MIERTRAEAHTAQTTRKKAQLRFERGTDLRVYAVYASMLKHNPNIMLNMCI